MSKKAKSSRSKKPMDPERAAAIRRFVLRCCLLLFVVSAVTFGFRHLQAYVDKRLTFPAEPPKVVLKNRPIWMSDFLAEQIAKVARPIGTHSSFDHKMLQEAAEMLRSDPRISPWIKEIRSLRRVYGNAPGDTLEIDCDYRTPIALVQSADDYWLVDTDGVKLPEKFNAQQVPRILFGRDGRTNIRIISGVRNPPPVLGGHRWTGDDLQAGLELVKLLAGRPYTEEILKVDVTNYDGRVDPREAQLVLTTKHMTQIRWGRPVNAKDYFVEVSYVQKLDYLQRVYEEYRRVDAGQAWIDIRFDKITYPSPEKPTAHALR